MMSYQFEKVEAASTMRPMPRNLPGLNQKPTIHTVNSQSRTTDSKTGNEAGLTYSIEEDGSTAAAKAEYEVLKAILARENYLQRLQKVVRTISKKIKPELADVLDLIRQSSLDVIESVENWRRLKKDPDATFLWNGLNYILKMPSDLDYLAEYIAIQKWMGFPLTRNPFCIPFAMESGATMLTNELLDPQNIDKNSLNTEGFSIGGTSNFSNTKNNSMSKSMGSIDMVNDSMNISKSRTLKAGDLSSRKPSTKPDLQSFILNEDMRKIRMAENVILRSEAKNGIMSRDPQGRLVPLLQALTRKAAAELKKDDKRPLTEPSTTTISYAPHAAKCDIGLAEVPWTPEVSSTLEEKPSKYLEVEDESASSRKRGESKSGGALAVIEGKGTESRQRRPVKPSISSKLDFERARQIRTLNDKVEEINKLKAQIEAMKEKKLEDERIKKTEILRSTLSGQSIGVSKTQKFVPPPNTPGTQITIDPDNIPGNFLGTGIPSAPSSPLSTKRKSAIRSNENTPKQLERKKLVREASLRVTYADDQKNLEQAPAPLEPDLKSSDPPLISEAEIVETENTQLKHLQVELSKANRRLHYYHADEDMLTSLKDHEKEEKIKERSREIERKRRLLTLQEAKKKGPASEDKPNVFDYYAVRIQSVIRGWLARCWVRWYRIVSRNASVMIQSVIRGWFGRMRVRRIRQKYDSAVLIQKNFRGWCARGTSMSVAKQRILIKKAIVIQRVWRGILGFRRAQSKRALDLAAKQAFDAVDTRTLVASDVKELAKRIMYAIEEPTTTSFPPDEVLQLIRLTVIVLQCARGNLGIADYDFFNIRHYDEVGGEALDWKGAAKMVNRSERFLRLIRVVAFGPGAKPPRLIQLNGEGNLLYAAQARNPRWCIQTFETIGMGSRICCQLFKWLSSMIEIATRQQEFLSLIATSFPDWLPKLNEHQKVARTCEFEIEINKKCLQLLQDHEKTILSDDNYKDLLEIEIKLIKRALNDVKIRLRDSMVEIDKLKNDQSSRELFALTSMEQRVNDTDEELRNIAKAFQEMSELADKGDRGAIEGLSEVKNQLTNQRLKLSELTAQKKLLEIQVESNRAKRKDPARLTPDIIFKCIISGEAKAAYIISQVDAKAMLKSAGVKDPEDLPFHLAEIYDPLGHKEKELRVESRKRFVEAELEKKAYDDLLSRAIAENDVKEQKSKDRMMPTLQELEEERLENEKEAIAERAKSIQYLPDHVLFEYKKRPRPILLALGRDLPGNSKRQIFEEIVKLMPGSFIPIDYSEHCGLNIESMQSILDSGQSIILYIDHGLTRFTRESFLNILELSLKSLIPSPLIAIAVGDEKNCRSDPNFPQCGTDVQDMAIFKDSKIKACLETISWVGHKLVNSSLRKECIKASIETQSPTKTLSVVLEALYYLFENKNVTPKALDPSMHSVSWLQTRLLLSEPNQLFEKVQNLRRGQATIPLLTCLKLYLNHPLWPTRAHEDRTNNLLLHYLATFIEQYLECELLGQQGGGVPIQAFTKSSMKGIQTVVTVQDETLTKVNKAIGFKHSKQAAALLIRATLQDLRIMKTVGKIDGDSYAISVYRDKNTIFFEAYDTKSSEVYLTSISSEEVPSLLIPNGFERNVTTNKILPPSSSIEMYEKLLKLLRFRTVKEMGNIIGKELLCKRDHTFLQQLVRRVDGYNVVIKAYEAALGELYFQVYIPEYGAILKTLLTTIDRKLLIKHSDKEESKEGEVAYLEDARPLVPYMIDRLHIYPSKQLLLSFQSIPKALKSSNKYLPKESQNMQLKLKIQGKVGRILCRRVISFFNVMFLLEIRSCTIAKILYIHVYEPITSKTFSMKLLSYQRQVLFQSDSDDYKLWLTKLLSRLKYSWVGEHSIFFDYTVYQKTVNIQKKRLILRFDLMNDNEIKCYLLDNILTHKYFAVLNFDDLKILASMKLPLEEIQNINPMNEDHISDTQMTDTIKNVPNEFNGSEEMKMMDTLPSTLVDLLSDFTLIDTIVSKLIYFLQYKNQNLPHLGFATKNCSVVMDFTREERELNSSENLKSINLTLRKKKFQQSMKTSKGDLDSLIRLRKQAPIIFLEEELSALALEKSKYADLKVEEDKKAALVLSEHFGSFADAAKLKEAIEVGSKSATNYIMNQVHLELIEKLRERNQPGSRQAVLEEKIAIEAENNKIVEVLPEKSTEDEAIVKDDWKLVLETGVKANFREGKVQWQGHVSIKVYQDDCWIGDFGMGQRFKFLVYEPNVSQAFEGLIRSKKHLHEILGMNGQDLMDQNKTKEMLMFISKYRLEVVVNKKTWDGEPVEEGAPPYRIEFQSDRVYTADKVTPINAAEEDDEEANNKKLFDIENARGKKIVRLVRRVSGLLMQLTVFELPAAVALATMTSNPIPGLTFTRDSDGNITQALAEVLNEAVNTETGFAEVRKELKVLERFQPPAFRIVGFDPRSKRKVTLPIEPQAIIEVSGGVFSPYLSPEKRKELARVVCEALILHFPSGRPFEIMIPWSGSKQNISTAEVPMDGKVSMRSSADRVVKRSGRLFRSVVRISKLDLIVSLYQHVSELSGMNQLIFNFYSPRVSEATEIALDESQQIERIGFTILSYPEGTLRATAIRHLCKFFRSEIIVDILDPSKKTLDIVLLPPNKDYETDYLNVGLPLPGDSIRPVGIPNVFFPLDTIGRVIHRRGMSLFNRDQKSAVSQKEFLVTVYTKSMIENPERGLVIKLYDRGTSNTSILHLGPSELIRICDVAQEPDILRDLVNAEMAETEFQNDNIENGFKEFTKRGELENETNKLVNIIVDIVLKDLGFYLSAQDTVVPYVLSGPRGILPM